MKNAIVHIGLDVHAQSITIAIAEGSGDARLCGTICRVASWWSARLSGLRLGCSDLHSVDKFLAKLRKAHPDANLRWCYEAGPTGFVLQRHIARKGMECLVAAPSLIPGRSGDRIKTDKRDAVKLARLLRAGELTGVHVPDAVDEAMRDLCRARTDAVQDQRRLRMQLKAVDSVAARRLLHPYGAAPASQSVSAAPTRPRLCCAAVIATRARRHGMRST